MNASTLRTLTLAPAAVAVTAATLPAPLFAQATAGRPLDHDVYSEWMDIDDETLSPDGRWVAYALEPEDGGDGTLRLRKIDTGEEHVVPRGLDPTFDDGAAFVVFRIAPMRDSVRQAKLDDVPSDEQPKDSLGVLNLATGEVTRIARVQSFALPDEGGAVVAYRLEEPLEEAEDSAQEAEPAAAEQEPEPGAAAAEDEDDDEEKDKPEGTTLVLRDLATGEEHRYEDVTGYTFPEDGGRLAYTASNEEGDADGAYVVDVATGEAMRVLGGEGIYRRLAWSEDGERLAFVTNRDDWDAEAPAWAVYGWNGGDDEARVVARAGSPGVPAGWAPSEHGQVEFSESGERLFFGTAPAPEPEPEDTVPDDEKVVLDVWHWQDPYLQPMQLEERADEENRTYLAVAHLDDGGRIVQLATETVPEVDVGMDGDADLAVGESELPYRMLISWDWPQYQDVYLVDVATGERRLVLERTNASLRLSPDERHLAWYDNRERDWFAMDVESGDVVNLTAGLDVAFWNEEHDRPYPAYPYGGAGWTTDGEALLVYDKYDVWALDPSGEDSPRMVTEGFGRNQRIEFRYVRLDPDEDAVEPGEPMLLRAFDDGSKASGFYRDRVDGDGRPERLVMMDRAFGFPRKAEDADRVLYTRQSFREFPDLWVAGLDFADARQISDANPQQAEYRWGTAELVSWRSSDGTPLEGILYKPDGFDATRRYPMMVYFYERSSDGLHRHRAPSPGGSSINISFYVSRGYVVFVPDVVYEEGYPGESALQCVVPGVLALIDEGFVDPERIGVQGHSWGGYQIAYMITRTNLFAAAEAGAPVSNMTSAYGGIRWGTGMSRMFQYERTQSRLGASLWDERDRYIQNSPLFWADRVRTPVMMMHNDEDTAVPWEQGIEFFVALRRLGRPAWLLNYNGEPHGLPDYPDRRDWAIRMQQFFDHYLKGAPAPVWLAEGIPATEKGETLGLEPAETPVETTAAGSGGDGGH